MLSAYSPYQFFSIRARRWKPINYLVSFLLYQWGICQGRQQTWLLVLLKFRITQQNICYPYKACHPRNTKCMALLSVKDTDLHLSSAAKSQNSVTPSFSLHNERTVSKESTAFSALKANSCLPFANGSGHSAFHFIASRLYCNSCH